MESSTRIALTVFSVILLFLAAMFLIGFILTFAATYLILSLILGIWGLVKMIRIKKNTFKPESNAHIVLSFIVLLFLIWFIGGTGSPLYSPLKWQYRFQKMYTSIYTPDSRGLFPEELPQGISDYSYDFFPSIMQGSGYVKLSFVADDEYVEELKRRCENEAILITSFDAPSTSSSEIIYDIAPLGYFTQDHPNAVYYILYTNNSYNHTRTDAIIIDGNTVIFSKI